MHVSPVVLVDPLRCGIHRGNCRCSHTDLDTISTNHQCECHCFRYSEPFLVSLDSAVQRHEVELSQAR